VLPGLWDCHGHLLGTRFLDLTALPLEPLALRAARCAADLRAALHAGVTLVARSGAWACTWPEPSRRAPWTAPPSMGRRGDLERHRRPRGIMAALEAGVRTIEHGTYLDEEACAAMRETGAILVPTRTILQEMLDSTAVPPYAVRKLEVIGGRHAKADLRRAATAAPMLQCPLIVSTRRGVVGLTLALHPPPFQAERLDRPELLGCGGAPRRNRTGDPILTMDLALTAVRTAVRAGHPRP
jgi:hypothetical protein